MSVKRMDNIGLVVEDIDAAIEFFTELGLNLEGRAPIEGDWADGVTGLRGMPVEIAMMRTPDGHSRPGKRHSKLRRFYKRLPYSDPSEHNG
jgi:catechol 2,3-dioxygenase-like lactoylglutathione lyase family enzyme